MQYEIQWNDLRDSAKERLKGLWHPNIYFSPIAIIEIEEKKNEVTK